MATIVVMEDDNLVRNFVTRLLQMQGYNVLAFEDAQPALDTVDFSQVDLMVTDLSMPTSGEEAIRIIRNRNIQIPIIVITGNITGEKALYLKTLGVQEIVRKPFDLNEFLAVVQRLI